RDGHPGQPDVPHLTVPLLPRLRHSGVLGVRDCADVCLRSRSHLQQHVPAVNRFRPGCMTLLPHAESSSTVSEAPSLTVVTCVEAGTLEPMAVRMVRSLRRWGGRYSNVQVIAVTPRWGPPLRPQTRLAFDE